MAAASELIGERGLAQLRMSDVAERAGMSVGHLTYYFPSKTQLLIRAISQSEERFHCDVTAALARQDDPWTRLVTLIELAGAEGPRDRGWLLWFEVWANAAVDGSVAEVQAELDGWWRHQMAEVIAYGIEQGAFHSGDPARVAAVLSALTDGMSVQVALGDGSTTRDDLLDIVLGSARDALGVAR